ncbi:MAG TPA: choice-of-anchor D domain-containing protein [Candidatus Kapabacteria bacterium]
MTKWICTGLVLSTIVLVSVPALAGFPLSFDKTSLSFGNVIRPQVKELALNITDTSPASIELSSLAINGLDASDFSVVSPSTPLVIASGSIATEIIIEFNPKGFATRTGNLVLVTSAGNVDIPLSGFGIGGSSLSFADSAIDFGALAPSGERDSILELYSSGIDTATIDGVTIAASDLSFSASLLRDTVLPLRMAPGDSIAVKVSFQGMTLAGQKQALLGAILEDGINSPTCELLGSDLYGSFEMHPDSIDFGSMYVGQVMDSTIYLVNTSTVDISFDGLDASPSGDDFSIVAGPVPPFTIPAGDSVPIVIEANPGLETSHFSQLQIVCPDDDTNYKSANLTVAASRAPVIGPSIQDLSYYCALVIPLSDTVSVFNSGLKDLIVTGIASGTGTLRSSLALPDTIFAGGHQIVIFHFDPSELTGDTIPVELMGGNYPLFVDTIALQSLRSTAVSLLAAEPASGAAAQALQLSAGSSLTPFGIDTVVVHLDVEDPNIATIDPSSITSALPNVTVISITPEAGGYAVTLASPSPIATVANSSLLSFRVDRFVSTTSSTGLISTVETPEKAGCLDWPTDTIVINGPNVCGSTSIQDELSGHSIFSASILQNPISNSLDILVQANQPAQLSMKILNALGATVSEQTITVTAGNNTFTLPTSSLHRGMFDLEIGTANGAFEHLPFVKVP